MPNRKVNVPSKYPRVNIVYKKAIPVLGAVADYDLIKLNVEDDIRLGLFGTFAYRANAGYFINNKTMYFMDYQHFNGNQTILANSDYLNSFKLLPYYTYSTNKEFIELHAESQSTGSVGLPRLRQDRQPGHVRARRHEEPPALLPHRLRSAAPARPVSQPWHRQTQIAQPHADPDNPTRPLFTRSISDLPPADPAAAPRPELLVHRQVRLPRRRAGHRLRGHAGRRVRRLRGPRRREPARALRTHPARLGRRPAKERRPAPQTGLRGHLPHLAALHGRIGRSLPPRRHRRLPDAAQPPRHGASGLPAHPRRLVRPGT